MESLFGDFGILEENIGGQDFIGWLVDRFDDWMGQNLVDIKQRGGIAFLDFLFGDALLQIDGLRSGDIEACDDGD